MVLEAAVDHVFLFLQISPASRHSITAPYTPGSTLATPQLFMLQASSLTPTSHWLHSMDNFNVACTISFYILCKRIWKKAWYYPS